MTQTIQSSTKSSGRLSTLKIDTPRWLVPFLEPARYKAAYGGRGSGKSHAFADMLVERPLLQRTRAVCVREVQNTIRDSVRQLLVDKIQRHGLERYYDVKETEIIGPNKSLFVFRGMQNYNADNIKSLEDFDVAWVEEAQTLSARSLRLLRPTIRSPGSELWFSWNPRHDTDAVDALFRGPHPPSGSVVRQVNWRDNPWFPAELKQEMADDYAADPISAAHVWEGEYEAVGEGAYYARWIHDAENDGRIGDFGYRHGLPVLTSWDIGVDDYTAIWFWQVKNDEAWVIDYFEAQGIGAEQIIEEALPEYAEDVATGARQLHELGRWEPWRYGAHFLPHDVRVREWGAGARSRVETLTALGLRDIRKGAAANPEDRVAAGRRLLPHVRFNASPRVQIGVNRLRRYTRRYNEQLGIWMGPLKDGNDHGADAFGEFAVNAPIAKPKAEKPKPTWKPNTQIVLPGPPEPRSGRRIAL